MNGLDKFVEQTKKDREILYFIFLFLFILLFPFYISFVQVFLLSFPLLVFHFVISSFHFFDLINFMM